MQYFVFFKITLLLLLPYSLRPPLAMLPSRKSDVLKLRVYFSVESKFKPAAPNLSYMLSYMLLYTDLIQLKETVCLTYGD